MSLLCSAQSTAKIEELLQEDQNVKRRRERYQKQSSLLSKLTRQLSIHDNRAAAASSWSNGGGSGGMLLKAVLTLSPTDPFKLDVYIWISLHFSNWILKVTISV